MSSAIGMRLTAHVSAVGKAMLAALPIGELEARLAHVMLERMTENSRLDELYDDLRVTRARGYALDEGESSPDVACVAAAVLGADGELAAGMSISVSLSRMGGERRPALAQLVVAAAAELSRRLGYTRPNDLTR